jgi:hypothetical protein
MRKIVNVVKIRMSPIPLMVLQIQLRYFSPPSPTLRNPNIIHTHPPIIATQFPVRALSSKIIVVPMLRQLLVLLPFHLNVPWRR